MRESVRDAMHTTAKITSNPPNEPEEMVIANQQQMLQNWQKVGLCRGVLNQILEEIKALRIVLHVKLQLVEAMQQLAIVVHRFLLKHIELDVELVAFYFAQVGDKLLIVAGKRKNKKKQNKTNNNKRWWIRCLHAIWQYF